MLRTVDLFSGCGGLSIGFEKSGFNLVAAYENWEPAIKVHQLNFDYPIIDMDLSDIDDAVISVESFSPEIIIGGPPCQDFSHAGKRIESERAYLTSDFAEIIRRVSPRAFVMENVSRAQKSVSYSEARKIFKNAGYGLTEIVLDASKCGVPQNRRRFFSIGLFGAKDGFLTDSLEADLSNTRMTVRDYLGDKLGVEYYYRHPRNYNRRGIFSIDEPAPTVRGVNRPVPKGYLGHKNDPVPVTENLRPLTTYERSLLQTFPENFKWEGSKTALEQMIGNAVPVNLAYYVAEHVKEVLLD